MFEAVKAYFEGLGWLANMLALVPVFGGAYAAYKRREKILSWFGRRRYLSVADYISAHLIDYFFDKKKVKIVVIDDSPDDIPIEYLRETFGQVLIFEKISLAEASRVMGHDIVFLDMMGVVKEDPKYGGLQLIRKIKDLPDAPMVIAVSGARFDPTASDYFKAADDVLKKPVSEYQCEEVVKELVEEKFSPYKSADTIDGEIMAKSRDEKEKRKASQLIFNYLDEKIALDQLRAELVNGYRHMDTALLVAKAKRIKDAYAA
jgi:CheY-like chemotaxis protein